MDAVRATEIGLGNGVKRMMDSERGNLRIARKSVVAATAIARGEIFTPANLTLKRNNTGLPAHRFYDLVGLAADRDYAPDEAIRAD